VFCYQFLKLTSSKFINIAAGQDIARVGHGLDSCTTVIQAIPIRYPKDPDRRVVLIDTPCLPEAPREKEWLNQIEHWLETL
jgi:hypothetical protein